MFSTTQNDVVGNVTYTISATTGKSPSHLIVHLPSNTTYTVVWPIDDTVAQTYQLLVGSDPTKGDVYKSSSQGVLFFSAGAPQPVSGPPTAPTSLKKTN